LSCLALNSFPIAATLRIIEDKRPNKKAPTVRRKTMADEITPENESEQVEEVEVLDEADGTAVPEAGASSGWLCCSSSSSSSCCSAS
jgi:hypothetical protein